MCWENLLPAIVDLGTYRYIIAWLLVMLGKVILGKKWLGYVSYSRVRLYRVPLG